MAKITTGGTRFEFKLNGYYILTDETHRRLSIDCIPIGTDRSRVRAHTPNFWIRLL